METSFKRPLYDQICSFENLLWGFRQAAKKCKKSSDRCEFVLNLSSEIFDIQSKLKNGTYQWGGYVEKTVEDPKKRVIHKAPFRDRVVHQAICRAIGPLVERRMIHQSYACRKNKGTGAALKDVRHVLKNAPYALKMDVSKYFQSVHHDRLKQKLKKIFHEPRLLVLLENLIDSFPDGIPIGNLTSQVFANLYLNDLDHFIKRELKVHNYFRYMDDIVLLGSHKQELWSWAQAVREFAHRKEHLCFSEKKTIVYKVKNGVPFLGYWLFPDKQPQIQQRALQRFKNKLRERRLNALSESEVLDCIYGWYGHARFGLRPKLVLDLKLDSCLKKFKRAGSQDEA